MKRKTYLKCEPKYIVKKEEGMVICVLKCDMNLYAHPCFNVMTYNKHRKILPNVTTDGRFTVTAVTKCHKDDIFNEIKGKRIAESKAKVKAFNVASKVYNAYVKDLEGYAKILTENMGNCLIVMDEEIEHFNNLKK